MKTLFHNRTSFSGFAAVFLAAAVITFSPVCVHAEDNAEPLILEGGQKAFSPDGKRAVTTDSSKEHNKRIYRLYDTDTGKEIAKIEIETKYPRIHFDDKRMIIINNKMKSTDDEPNSLIYDSATGKEIAKLEGVYSQVSPDGKQVITIGGGASCRVYDTAAWKETAKFPGRYSYSYFSPDGKWAAINDYDDNNDTKVCRIYDTATWKETAKLKGICMFSPDSKWAIARDGRVYDTATWKETAKLECWISKFTPDGKQAITANGQVYDMTTWKQLVKLEGYTANGECRFTPDNKRAITDRGRIYDTATWKEQNTPAKFKGSGFEFSPDGKYVVGRYEEESTLTWTYWIYDTATGTEIAELCMRPYFFPDGKRVAISISDTTLITGITQLHRFPTYESIEEYVKKKRTEKKTK
jgi:WD40 repeat protein